MPKRQTKRSCNRWWTNNVIYHNSDSSPSNALLLTIASDFSDFREVNLIAGRTFWVKFYGDGVHFNLAIFGGRLHTADPNNGNFALYTNTLYKLPQTDQEVFSGEHGVADLDYWRYDTGEGYLIADHSYISFVPPFTQTYIIGLMHS